MNLKIAGRHQHTQRFPSLSRTTGRRVVFGDVATVTSAQTQAPTLAQQEGATVVWNATRIQGPLVLLFAPI